VELLNRLYPLVACNTKSIADELGYNCGHRKEYRMANELDVEKYSPTITPRGQRELWDIAEKEGCSREEVLTYLARYHDFKSMDGIPDFAFLAVRIAFERDLSFEPMGQRRTLRQAG
jgi:hypothetical protein